MDKDKRPTKDSDLSGITCFKCRGRGHLQRDCPNPRALTASEFRVLLEEREEYCGGEESEGSHDEEDVDGEADKCFPEQHSFVVRKTLLRAKEDTPSQRENIFMTKCRVNGEICDLIVDSGSESNVVSKEMVERMGLQTTRHPRPYRLSWLEKDKQASVRRQCQVSFQIGSYEDEILCDVVAMDACQILLGRPWQTDKRSHHDGFTNVYTITHRGVKKELHPLPPIRQIPKGNSTPEKIVMLNYREFEREIEGEGEVYLLYSHEIRSELQVKHPELLRLLEEYEDVFPSDLPRGLPPLRGIEPQFPTSQPIELIQKRLRNSKSK